MTINVFILFLLAISCHKQNKIAKQHDLGGIDKRQNYLLFNKNSTSSLKGILALFIMFHHLGIHTDIPVISYIFSTLGTTVTGMFFFISGYGVGISYLKKGETYISGFIPKRFHKILPIFLTLSILYIAIQLVFMDKNLALQLQSFIEGNPPLPNSWFIFAIIYFYLTFYISCLISKKPQHIGLILILFTGAYILLTKEILHFEIHWWVSYSCATIGYFTAIKPAKLKFYNILVLLICIQVLLTVNDKTHFLHLSTNGSYLLHTFTMVFRSICIYAIICSLGIYNSKALALLGGISFEIYMTHGIPMEIGVYYNISDAWLIAMTVTIAIVLSLIIHNSNKITKRIRSSAV